MRQQLDLEPLLRQSPWFVASENQRANSEKGIPVLDAARADPHMSYPIRWITRCATTLPSRISCAR